MSARHETRPVVAQQVNPVTALNQTRSRVPSLLSTIKFSTAPPLVDLAAKSKVEWFDDSQYYGLRASSDVRFKIRHAPIPEPGSPWPMPQLYQPSNISFRVSPHGFEFHSVGKCIILLVPCNLVFCSGNLKIKICLYNPSEHFHSFANNFVCAHPNLYCTTK